MTVTHSGPVRRRTPLPAAIAAVAALLLAAYLVIIGGGPAHAAATLLSQGKPTTASSTENASFPASNATDGITGTRRFVRMLGTARTTQFGYSLWEFQVFGSVNTGAACGTTDAALNRPATASSTENATFPASNAVDGNTSTRWSSAFSDPQWLQVDLGSTQSICQVTLNWEAAFASAFQIQTSTDAATWTTIFATTTG